MDGFKVQTQDDMNQVCGKCGKRKISTENNEEDEPPKKKMKSILHALSPKTFSPGANVKVTSPDSCDSRTDETSDKSNLESESYKMRPPSLPTTSPKYRLPRNKEKFSLEMKTIIRVHFKYLKEELNPKELADLLCEDELIDSELLEQITESKNRRRQVDLLLKGLISAQQQHQQRNIRELFFKSLRKTGHEYLIDKLTKQPEIGGVDYLPPSVSFDFLQKMKKTIEDDVEPLRFMDDILVLGGISFNDHEDILKIVHRRKRIKTLIEVIHTEPRNVNLFVQPMIKAYPSIHQLYSSFCEHSSMRDRECPRSSRISGKKCVNESSPSGPVNFKLGSTVNCKFSFAFTDQNMPVAQESTSSCEDGKSLERKIVNGCNESYATQAAVTETIMEECSSLFDKLHFSSIIVKVKTMSDKSLENILKACRSGKAAEWLTQMLSDEDIKQLQNRNVQKVTIEVSADENESIGDNINTTECKCTVNKRSITCNFTYLTDNIRGSRKTIEEIAKTGKLTEEQNKELFEQSKIKDLKIRNEKLLRFLLHKNTPEVFCCVLEKQLKQHGGKELIKKIGTDCRPAKRLTRFTRKTIKNHMLFLKEELDAWSFVRALSDRNESKLVESILGKESRRERTEELLEFLSKEKRLTWFEDELKKQKLDYILNVIHSQDKVECSGDSSNLVIKLMANFSVIVEEIDPIQLKAFVLESSLIPYATFARIEDLPSRRQKAVMLMKEVMKIADGERARLFLQAMSNAGYEHIAKQIEEDSSAVADVCPRILALTRDPLSNQMDSRIFFKGCVELQFESNAVPSNTDGDIVQQSVARKSQGTNTTIFHHQTEKPSVVKQFKATQRVDIDSLSESGMSSTFKDDERVEYMIVGKDSLLDCPTTQNENTRKWVDTHFKDQEDNIFLHPSWTTNYSPVRSPVHSADHSSGVKRHKPTAASPVRLPIVEKEHDIKSECSCFSSGTNCYPSRLDMASVLSDHPTLSPNWFEPKLDSPKDMNSGVAILPHQACHSIQEIYDSDESVL